VAAGGGTAVHGGPTARAATQCARPSASPTVCARPRARRLPCTGAGGERPRGGGAARPSGPGVRRVASGAYQHSHRRDQEPSAGCGAGGGSQPPGPSPWSLGRQAGPCQPRWRARAHPSPAPWPQDGHGTPRFCDPMAGATAAGDRHPRGAGPARSSAFAALRCPHGGRRSGLGTADGLCATFLRGNSNSKGSVQRNITPKNPAISL